MDEMTGKEMDFGEALRAMKSGLRVCRTGWNGKGMWISMTEGQQVPSSNIWSPNVKKYAELQPSKSVAVLSYIVMKTATGEILMGWLASQSDMLSEDWEVFK